MDRLDKMPSANRRLFEIIGAKTMGNVSEFSRMIASRSQQAVDRLLKPNKKTGEYPNVSYDMAKAIERAYPDCPADWILYGTVKGSNNTIELSSVGALTDENSLKFYYELSATASDIDGLTDNEINQPFQRIYIPGYEGCVGFKTTGESMLPTLKHGDIVVVERKTAETIVNGEIYLVVTRDGQRMIKRLVQQFIDDEGIGHIMCVSDNPNKEIYRSFEITTNMIHTISRVKGYVSYSEL